MDILSIIFPRRCPICDGTLAYGKGKICDLCKGKVNYITEPRCKKCGKQLIRFEDEYCFDCKNKKHFYRTGVALVSHTGAVRKSIYSIKYNNKREYVDFFVDEIVKRYRDEIMSWKCQVIIPVPLHKKKKIKRGYNQAEIIAKKISERLNIPFDNKILKRVKNTRPQKELNDFQRKKNLENAFEVPEKRKQNEEVFKKIIIVDDIYTTGSTIDACAKELLKNGAQEIYYISLSIGTGY